MPRRRNRQGWAEPQHPKNRPTWWRARYYTATGEIDTVRDGAGKVIHFGRKSDAMEAANAAYHRCRRSAPVVDEEMTWGEWWDLIAQDRQHFVSQTPYREQRIVEIHLRPRWGNVPLGEINGRDIQQWVNKTLTPGRQASTVSTYFTVFSLSLQLAVKQNVLFGSPTVGVKLPVRRRVRDKNIVDMARLREFLVALEPGGYDQIFLFGIYTGLRPGELTGIHLDNLDRSRSRLWVASVYVQNQHVIRSWPKNKHVRKVPLPKPAWTIVDKIMANRQQAPDTCGIPHASVPGIPVTPCSGDLLFRSPEGEIIRPHTFHAYMERALKRHGLPHTTPYALRRTYITWLRDNGYSATEIGSIVDHANLTETMNYMQDTPAALEKLNETFKGIGLDDAS